MTSLKEVNITKNSEKISDLSFLKNLENLENLEISFPEGVGYSVIGKLPKLKFLTIFRSKVGSFDFLTPSNNLEEITMLSNELSSLDGIQHAKNLKNLHASSNNIKSLKPLEHLKEQIGRASCRERMKNIA